jgi:LAO/AO transport system kinase
LSSPANSLPARSSLSGRVLAGEPRALARAISLIEDEAPATAGLVRDIYTHTGRAYLVGITGPPGAGKSTLVDRLAAEIRKGGETVGIIAVDPTSPFTGGAILGDRLRMNAHASDPGVFIRSMATRGSLGGLARATGEVVKLLSAFGHDWVLIETVGVGQTELDIMKIADTTVVVLVPESGDAIQTMKAGLMEAADIFVVNKADRPGAPALMAELRFAAHLHDTSAASRKDVDWQIPVLSLEAQRGVGVPELVAEIRRHRAVLESSGAFASRRRERARQELEALLVDAFRARVERGLRAGEFRAVFEDVVAGTRDPYSAAAAILPVISLERL